MNGFSMVMASRNKDQVEATHQIQADSKIDLDEETIGPKGLVSSPWGLGIGMLRFFDIHLQNAESSNHPMQFRVGSRN